VENPSLPLDPSRENKDTDDTEGEEGKDDPKGSVSGMGRVDESSLGLGLIVSYYYQIGHPRLIKRSDLPKVRGGKGGGARVHRGDRGDRGGAYQFHREDRW
jgi:hypothetical protein